jgi:hypothetical protein
MLDHPLIRMSAAAAPLLSATTVALFGIQENQPIQNGSGVLLQIADTYLLLSAAHVLDAMTSHGFDYLIGTGAPSLPMIPLERVEVHSVGMPASGDRDDDPFDIAFVRLSADIADGLLRSGKRFLRLSQTDSEDRSDAESGYAVYGFPFSLTSNDIDRRVASFRAVRYVTDASRNEKGESRRYDPDRDILLHANPDDIIDEDGTPVSLPRLKGISGCGIWRLTRSRHTDAGWSADDVRLVGIEHTVTSNPYFIRGTRIAVMNRLIWNALVDLRAAMRVGFTQV